VLLARKIGDNMQRNRLKALWKDGGFAINAFLSIPCSFSAEIMAHQGYDALTVDFQHGMHDFASALASLQAISTTDVVPLVRVPGLEPSLVMKTLDAGAYGVICPLVNNRRDAEAFVSYCRYPPVGGRSFGPNRVALYSGPDYVTHANDEMLTIAMVETEESLSELDGILSTPGLDAVYVGPADLSMALGISPSFEPADERLLTAFAHVAERARAHGKVAGIHTGSAQYAWRMVGLGYQLVTLSVPG
jgi:4-hydroxy-2-oxoheptanedioate aldolase